MDQLESWQDLRFDNNTLTRNAGLLVVFLAILVSVQGNSLWRLLTFILHPKPSKGPRDGLHYQQKAFYETCNPRNYIMATDGHRASVEDGLQMAVSEIFATDIHRTRQSRSLLCCEGTYRGGSKDSW